MLGVIDWLKSLQFPSVKEHYAVIGIIVSLGWNLVNTFLSSRQWRKNQKFNEFRSLKTPIDAALGKLRETRLKMSSASMFGGTSASFDKLFKEINKDLAEHWISLIVALQACDTSPHWPKNDLSIRYENKWDDIIHLAEGVYNQKTPEAKGKQSTIIAGMMTSLIDQVAEEAEDCLSEKIKGESFWRKLAFWKWFKRSKTV